MSIDRVLDAARARLVRPGPAQAAERVAAGALLVDTRPEWQRREYGEIPGATVLERNHLEWRLDPTSDARIPEAVGPDVEVLLFCQEGYSSSLAAASLLDVGLSTVTDLDGGFAAWAEAGLPTVPGGTPAGGRSPAAASPAA